MIETDFVTKMDKSGFTNVLLKKKTLQILSNPLILLKDLKFKFEH